MPDPFASNNSTTPLILQTIENGVVRLTLNQPNSRNALSIAMLEELQLKLEIARDLANKGAARVIVIAANGPAFCAGHDLKEIDKARIDKDGGLMFFEKLMQSCTTVMQSVTNHPLPIIADIRGVASAAGCQLVASCDLAFASTNAKFATPGVNIGLFCSTPMVALSRNVGRKHAMEMLLSGELYDANHAKQIGLVNQVLDETKIDAAIEKCIQAILSKSAKIITIGKSAFYQQAEMGLAQAYEYTSDVMVKNLMEKNAREGIQAFIGKRKPKWLD